MRFYSIIIAFIFIKDKKNKKVYLWAWCAYTMTSFVSGVGYEKVGLLVGGVGACGGLRSVFDKLQKIGKGV